MKITWYEGDSKHEFEGSVEEWLALSGATCVNQTWKPWMEDFQPCPKGPSYSFVFKATREGHDWWAANHNTTTGLARFEEMKREYKAWKDENQ